MTSSQKVVKKLLEKGILVEPDAVDEVDESIVDQISEDDVVLDREKIRKLKEKRKKTPPVQILENYEKEPEEKEENHFIQHYNKRYETLSNMLQNRQELKFLSSVDRVLSKDEKETSSIIGMVRDKYYTKNDHIMLNVEDPTGVIKVLITKDRKELYELGRDLVMDEVIGVAGNAGDDIIFADNIIQPDVPLSKEYKKSPEEEYAVFISDVEVGSVNFLKEEFEKFIKWINGKHGGEKHQKIASKVKYLFIVGDLVSGVGVYPGQEEELTVKDIRDQFQTFIDYIDKIPNHINIIICPGNHDAGRITEPQPPQYKDFPEEFQKRENVTLVSNPSTVRIGQKPKFGGFDVLLYHGYSLPYYADTIPSVRDAGGQKRSDLIMEYYLKWRHLAPTHASNMYIPDKDYDPLVINKVPDFLATGHIHRTAVGKYRNVSLLNCSAWTAPTEYQEKRGLEPQPGRAIVTNLKTRKTRVLRFWRREDESE